jgi:cell division transport system permease protein
MKQKTGQDFLSVLEANPLPASYVVGLVPDSITSGSVEPIIESLKLTYGIDDLVYDYTLTLKILDYINSSKQIIYGVSIFLVLLSIYLVYSNNKLLLSSHLNRYNTMKLVGAKLRTIKIPIFLNGVIVGLVSAAICLGIYYLGINFISRFYNAFFLNIQFWYLAVFVTSLGIILGFLGSYLATLNVSLRINKKL